jgi:hypothetical protein
MVGNAYILSKKFVVHVGHVFNFSTFPQVFKFPKILLPSNR